MSGSRARAGRGEQLLGCLQTCSRDMQPAAERPLCLPAVPLGTVVVPGDSDLELCRAHIERLQQVSAVSGTRWGTRASSPDYSWPTLTFASVPQEPNGAGAKSPTCHQLSSKWCFLDGESALF